MAVRIELHKNYVQQALEAAIASLKRSTTKQLNPAMKDLIDKDIAAISHALNTITEVK